MMKTRKAIVFGVLLALAFIAFTGIASASTIYVPDDYSTIQAAVNAASSGDTIIVQDGTYTENIEVEKKRLTIRSENGPNSTIVQAEDPNDVVFEVTADYVKISGFTVEGATDSAGIHLDNADYCNISNNNCSNNWVGICLGSSNNNSISNNICSNNVVNGIRLYSSSHNNSISNNICSNNIYGIFLGDSKNNSISNNICSNKGYGVGIHYSKDNSISNNKYSNNSYGIELWKSNNNHIYLNNFINNANNVDSSESTNTWNSPEKITYSYGRRTYTSHLGNYYDDYTGTDRNRDGIGDTPYQIDEDRDRYPLMEPGEKYFAPSERQSEIIYFILRWILED